MADSPESLFDLQYRLLYATVVAGKKYTFAENIMEKFLRLLDKEELPFDYLRKVVEHKTLHTIVHLLRTGSYKRIERCWAEIIELDPETCTVEELEAVHGVGPKTARFFVMWTRPDEKVAVLDTHILRWLRELGHDAPQSTPPAGPKYEALEQVFLLEAEKRGMTPKQLDTEIWETYSGYREAQHGRHTKNNS